VFHSLHDGVRLVRDWIDHLSFRARAVIITVVAAATLWIIAGNPHQTIVNIGKDLLEMAGAATWK
jgi:hypothetical protein